jgi:hypothetical protein
MFLLIGAFFIVTEHKLVLRKQEARMELGRQYYSWFGDLFDNTKTITGNAIRLDWLPS